MVSDGASTRSADRVEFTGHTDAVADQFDRVHGLVHASVISEPFGISVIEAMAAGVPVIAADAGGQQRSSPMMSMGYSALSTTRSQR